MSAAASRAAASSRSASAAGGTHSQPLAVALERQRPAVAPDPRLEDERHALLVGLELDQRRLRPQPGLEHGQRLQPLVVAGAQQPRADAGVEGQVLVDLVAEALEREPADLLVQRAPVRGIALHEIAPADAAEHLVAVPVRAHAVAQRARLHVLVDQVEHLADVAEVARGLELGVGRVLPLLPLHPVVTGVAGEDRDPLRVEVGVHREHVVLEPPAALGEADAVLVEQRLAEQLVRRQEAHQRRPLERDVAAVPLEHRARDELALADDLADHDVRLVALGAGHKPPQRVLAEPVVVVDEVDVLAAGHLDAEVARPAGPAGVGDVLDADVRMLRRQGVEAGGRLVRGAVVDEDHLELLGRQRLAEQRGDAVVYMGARVVDGHDHAHLEHALHATRRRADARYARHTTAVPTVSVTFDNLGEAAELERGTWPQGRPLGEHFSVRESLPQLLGMLAADDIRATFFLEGLNGELYPEALSGLAAAGHEVACHGWRHEPWAGLGPDRERELLARARTALGDPAGFRPPGGRLSEHGAGLLSALGFAYCSPAGSRPGRLDGVAVLPFRWRLIDAYHYLPHFGELRRRNGDPEEPMAPAALLERRARRARRARPRRRPPGAALPPVPAVGRARGRLGARRGARARRRARARGRSALRADGRGRRGAAGGRGRAGARHDRLGA